MKKEVNSSGKSRNQTSKEKETKHNKKNISKVFLTALAIVSILGFLEIISLGFFEIDISFHAEALLMIIIGVALIAEAQLKKIRSIKNGLTHNNFSRLITIIFGLIAIVAGTFSFPGLRFENNVFLAVKSLLALIAIVIIIIQTWIVK
ncbi:MAG: hypothetical protein ABIF88_01190 [archaeon]